MNVSIRLVLFGCLLTANVTNSSCMAQDLLDNDTVAYAVICQQPEFPGGIESLKSYLKKVVQYPVAAQKAHVSGYTFVQFIVEKNGCLSNIRVLKGLGYGCDEEAILAVAAMPPWLAGCQDNKPKRVNYTLPIFVGPARLQGHGRSFHTFAP